MGSATKVAQIEDTWRKAKLLRYVARHALVKDVMKNSSALTGLLMGGSVHRGGGEGSGDCACRVVSLWNIHNGYHYSRYHHYRIGGRVQCFQLKIYVILNVLRRSFCRIDNMLVWADNSKHVT